MGIFARSPAESDPNGQWSLNFGRFRICAIAGGKGFHSQQSIYLIISERYKFDLVLFGLYKLR